ncbi:MAG: DUF115 domain-containing protein [Treponema sp.]|jgi:hypothetical protein|nr:DUF115 domain-containing protein [Treponema sp.]
MNGPGQALHSRYNPVGEAERYVESLALSPELRFLILLEPGLGYMIPPLKKRLPNARIIALHAEAPGGDAAARPDAAWDPARPGSLREFLEEQIPDTQSRYIKVIEWRPGLGRYGEGYLKLLAEAAEFIKQGDANQRTTEAFGRRWVKNFFKNLSIIRRVCLPARVSLPLVLAGAGPGLEETTPLIAARRDSLFVLAVSSSLMALKTGAVVPDMVISADGGNWALLHLFEYVRLGAYPPLALCLSAALPSRCGEAPLLPVSDGSLWQTLILNRLGIPFITLPQRGTVAASALDLALLLTGREIFLAGLDFSHRDIRSHARPYALDRLQEEGANRLNPLYRQRFFRSSAIAAGGSHGIYAAWFKEQINKQPGRIYPLGDDSLSGAVPPATGRSGGAGEAGAALRAPFRTASLPAPDPRAAGLLALGEALEAPRLGERLRAELGPLLFPGREEDRRGQKEGRRGNLLEELRGILRHG